MNAYEMVKGYFLKSEQEEMDRYSAFPVTEIRVRLNVRPVCIWNGKEGAFGKRYTFQMLEELILRMTGHSLYAWEDELGQGYFSMPLGVRVGVSGRFVQENGKTRLADAYSVLIRLAMEVEGCAEGIIDSLFKEGRAASMIVISPPGGGKTTFLRDAARLLSERGAQVCVIDERHEIAAFSGGQTHLNVGARTDICEGLNKAQAAFRLIRSMAPEVIVMDEIGSEEDAQAIWEAVKSGVIVLASAHAGNVLQACERKMLSGIMSGGAFQYALVLARPSGSAPLVYEFREGIWHLRS